MPSERLQSQFVGQVVKRETDEKLTVQLMDITSQRVSLKLIRLISSDTALHFLLPLLLWFDRADAR